MKEAFTPLNPLVPNLQVGDAALEAPASCVGFGKPELPQSGFLVTKMSPYYDR